MEGFKLNKKEDVSKDEESEEILNADHFLELEKEDPVAYKALMEAIERREEENLLNQRADEEALIEKHNKHIDLNEIKRRVEEKKKNNPRYNWQDRKDLQ